MARGGHGLPKISPLCLPCPTLLRPVSRPPPNRQFRGWPRGRSPCGRLLPPWIPLPVRACWTPHAVRLWSVVGAAGFKGDSRGEINGEKVRRMRMRMRRRNRVAGRGQRRAGDILPGEGDMGEEQENSFMLLQVKTSEPKPSKHYADHRNHQIVRTVSGHHIQSCL
jgi:hypothetical protein